MTRILLTCFGPFPGAPANPSERVARRIARSRRLGIAGITADVQRFETVWTAVSEAPGAIARWKPDAVVMFGLAGRRRHISIEQRGTRHWSALASDAAGKRLATRLRPDGFSRRTRFNAASIAALLRRNGANCKVSRSAGTYLCNACYYSALGCDIPVVFIHIPGPMPGGRPRWRTKRRRMPQQLIETSCLAAVLETARQFNRSVPN